MLSFIVPVYKVEKYIRRCLDSILAQTRSDFEIITVDDGSPDASGSICDEYAEKYSCVTSLHKENGGLASARNFGMLHAKGEWIAFADSDDWIEPDYVECCLQTAEEYRDCDVISFGYYIDYVENDYSVDRAYPEEQYFGTDSIGRAVVQMELPGMFNSVCNKVYRASIMQGSFPERMEPGEDILFNCALFPYVTGCVLITRELYHYMRQGENTLTKKYDPLLADKIQLFIDARAALYEELDMADSEYLDKYRSSYVISALYNNYSPDSMLSHREKRRFIGKAFADGAIRTMAEKPAADTYGKIFRLFYSLNSPFIADIGYTVLFGLRNRFKGTYNKFRKKQLLRKEHG